jgi:hypothetical protein
MIISSFETRATAGVACVNVATWRAPQDEDLGGDYYSAAVRPLAP